MVIMITIYSLTIMYMQVYTMVAQPIKRFPFLRFSNRSNYYYYYQPTNKYYYYYYHH